MHKSKIMRTTAVLAVTAAAAVLLTACGSGGASETAAAPTATNTAAAPTTTATAPAESNQPPCSFIRPITDNVTNGSVTQATLDQWQAVLTVGCPARQAEFGQAVQVRRDAAASASASATATVAAAPVDKTAQRAELIAAADATVQAELLVMLGNARSQTGSC